jgi:hypothetical protein
MTNRSPDTGTLLPASGPELMVSHIVGAPLVLSGGFY